MVKFFNKLFCLHKWNTHSKCIRNWSQQEIVDGTEWWYEPQIEEQRYSETVEVLICEHCGKIEKLKY